MSSFEAVVDAVKDEGMSLRQQLAAQAPEQESPAVRDAKDAENAGRQEKQIDLLTIIAENVTGQQKKLDEMKDTGDSSLWGAFKKALLFGTIALAIPAIQAFLESGGWEKLKDGFVILKKFLIDVYTYIEDKILPLLTIENFKAMGRAVLDFICYIGDEILPVIGRAYEFIKEQGKRLFEYLNSPQAKQDLCDAIEFMTGIVRGVISFGKAVYKSYKFVKEKYESAVKFTSDIFLIVFNFLEGKDKDGKSFIPEWMTKPIGELIGDAFTSAKKWFQGIPAKFCEIIDEAKNLFDFSGVINTIMNLNLVKYVKSVFDDLVESICGIFAGDFSMENLLKGGKALLDIVQEPLNIAINTIKDIFKFGDPKEPFRVSKFITDVAQNVVCWFEDTFSWKTIKSKIESGFDFVKDIGDNITNLITSVSDWFKETFKFENIIKSLPEAAVDLLKFAGKIPKTADDLRKELEELEKGIAEGTGYGGIGASGLDLFTSEEELEAAKKQAEMLRSQLANMQTGGITTQEGLVNIHPQEAVIPLEKMSEVINKINTAALSKTGSAGAPVVVNNVTNAPVDASSSSVTNAAAMPISPPTNYVAIL